MQELAIDLDKHEGATWTHIDVALRTIAKRRGALDALEVRWLREGLRVRIWREVGLVSMIDYVERRLGYAPRTARDRVRVATALGELPKLEAALQAGLPHSAVRELTRVCTNENEQLWLDEIRGKSVHEIENLVAGRGRGSNPKDPVNPNLVGRTVSFGDIVPATEALLRDARRKAHDERGPGNWLSDNDLLATLLRTYLEDGSSERTKAPYQVAVIVCELCKSGWQTSGGRNFALSPADVERACCDSERIGSLETDDPERAAQDVPPSTRRHVHRRDGGRCRIPGCRSTRCLEIHHIVARVLGGSHDSENLILLCDSCHAALHRGLLTISGTSSELVVTRTHQFAYDQDDDTDINAASMQVTADWPKHVRNANTPLLPPGTCVEGDADRVRPETGQHCSTPIEMSAHVGQNLAQPSMVCPENAPQEPSATLAIGGTPENGTTCYSDGSSSPRNSNAAPLPPGACIETTDRGAPETGQDGSTTVEMLAHVGQNPTQPSIVSREQPQQEATAGCSRFERERLRTDARKALVGLGFRSGEAGKAVDLALDHLGPVRLEDVIREALRCCGR